MKIIFLVVTLIACGACTSLSINQQYLSKACKSGVKSYDDGTANFECYDKNARPVETEPRTKTKETKSE